MAEGCAHNREFYNVLNLVPVVGSFEPIGIELDECVSTGFPTPNKRCRKIGVNNRNTIDHYVTSMRKKVKISIGCFR